MSELPEPVAKYLETAKQDVGQILDQLFAADAIVHDEGHTHSGLAAIRTWNSSVASAFQFTREIQSINLHENSAIVQVKLEGDFPGSPVELHHHFSLADGKISAMTICP